MSCVSIKTWKGRQGPTTTTYHSPPKRQEKIFILANSWICHLSYQKNGLPDNSSFLENQEPRQKSCTFHCRGFSTKVNCLTCWRGETSQTAASISVHFLTAFLTNSIREFTPWQWPWVSTCTKNGCIDWGEVKFTWVSTCTKNGCIDWGEVNPLSTGQSKIGRRRPISLDYHCVNISQRIFINKISLERSLHYLYADTLFLKIRQEMTPLQPFEVTQLIDFALDRSTSVTYSRDFAHSITMVTWNV